MRGSIDVETFNGLPTTSFWECKEYQRTVKRIETSNKVCSKLARLVYDRAEIERLYSENLKFWSQRVLKDSSLEYGTSVSSLWKGLVKEAEAVSNAHESIHDIIKKEIHVCIKQWQKDHYHKTTLRPHSIKQAKQLEHDFEQVQRPWSKRLTKVNQSKKDYHQACQTERSLQVQVQNARTDPAGTAEQLRKVQEKLAKAEKEMERAKLAYTNALSELDQDNPRYLEEMTRVYNGSQELEGERLKFFKSVFSDISRALNVTTKADFTSIYGNLDQCISSGNVEEDLEWWSANHGIDMPVAFPKFEEYSPELGTISSRKRSQTVESTGGVTVTGISSIDTSSVVPQSEATENTHVDKNASNGVGDKGSTPSDEQPSSGTTAVTAVSQTEPTQSAADEVTDFYASATDDDGLPGVPVRALYDYTGQENDELTFSAGDVFEKLEDADDQGWSKGRKDGRAGLFPDNYVEMI